MQVRMKIELSVLVEVDDSSSGGDAEAAALFAVGALPSIPNSIESLVSSFDVTYYDVKDVEVVE